MRCEKRTSPEEGCRDHRLFRRRGASLCLAAYHTINRNHSNRVEGGRPNRGGPGHPASGGYRHRGCRLDDSRGWRDHRRRCLRGRIHHHRRVRTCDSRGRGDRSFVTGGTKVLSGGIKVEIPSNPGETFLDRRIALVEGATRQKDTGESV